MNKLKSQQGLTLVEVLAALVILGIVFVGIMTVFPQMTLFNNKTEAKLDTMNLARQEMAAIANTEWLGNLEGADFENQMATLGYAKQSETSEYMRFKKQNNYIYEIDLWRSCTEFVDEENEGNNCTFDKDTQVRLHQIHLKLYKQELLSSETFSYIRFRDYEVAN